MHERVLSRLQTEGLSLPPVPKPVAAYVPAVLTGSFAVTSGQLPIRNGELVYKGKIPKELTADDGYQAARLCALNGLAALASVVDLDKVSQVVRVGGYVQSAEGFKDQSAVMNGASELLALAFGERGSHARLAVGMAELPKDAAVEVEIWVSL